MHLQGMLKTQMQRLGDVQKTVGKYEALVAQLKALRAPALLSASERRPNELDNLRKYLTDNGLRYDERGSGPRARAGAGHGSPCLVGR